MKKKQKIILYRIIITAVMLVVLQFLPITGIPRLIAYLAAYLVIGYDILEKSRQGHPKRPRVRRKLFNGARHPRCILPRHLDKERRLS